MNRANHDHAPTNDEANVFGVTTPAHATNADMEQRTGGLQDPVCGLGVTAASPHVVQHQGNPIYFCGAGCKRQFEANPAKYLAPGRSASLATPPEATISGTTYTYPMHPQVRQDHPGACPKRGMALALEMPSLGDEDTLELKDFKQRFLCTLPLTFIVFVLAMAGHHLPWTNAALEGWVQLALTAPVVLWAGWPFFVRAVQSVIHRSLNMWTLIGLGTSAAFIYSLVATIVPAVFPASFIVMDRVPVYLEAAAVIISLPSLG